MSDLQGRVALVTGASQGIGRACAIALAEAGATVALCARNVEKLEAVAAEINGRQINGRRGVVAEAEGEMEGAAALCGGAASAGAGLAQAEAAVEAAAGRRSDPTRDGGTVTNGAPGDLDPTRDGGTVTNGAPGDSDPTRYGGTVTNGAPGDSDATRDGGTVTNGAPRAYVFALDLASEESIKECVKAVVAKLGKLEILVNNGGITRDILAMRMKKKDWDDVLATNLTGAFLMSQAVMSAMLKARWGRVINIASVVGEMGQAGQANYAASKAGLIGLTKSLARELASRAITVNAVAPGYIETAMTAVLTEEQKLAMTTHIPLGRVGTDKDIAAAVVFLASEGAGYITGHTLDVNGGMYMG